MKKQNIYKGLFDYQSEFSHRYACWANNHNGWAFFFKVYLDSAPTIERNNAQWIRTRTWYHDGELYCSACGYAPYDERDCGKICGNCGAIMTGGNNG